MVTRATFRIRNSRRQFLRLDLPENSQIWSAFVDGKAEKPAYASDKKDHSSVLLKMINSSSGFTVEIIYASRQPAMSIYGSLQGRLPVPDMVVTRSRWDIYLPEQFIYQTPRSNMNLLLSGMPVNPNEELTEFSRRTAQKPVQSSQALRIQVPFSGIHYAFEKLYVNQTDTAAEFHISYMAAAYGKQGIWLSLAGVLLIWFGIAALAWYRQRIKPIAGILLILSGVLLNLFAFTWLAVNTAPAAALTLLMGLLMLLALIFRKFRSWKNSRQAE